MISGFNSESEEEIAKHKISKETTLTRLYSNQMTNVFFFVYIEPT